MSVRITVTAPTIATITAPASAVSATLTATAPVVAVSLTGDAVEANVLSGKKFYSNSLTQKTGALTVPTLSLTTGILSIS